jgi:aminoglycoside phosphotransferase (APT) family kinase protein
MRFVRSNTTVPVPRVWLNVFWRGRSYIIMSRAPGVVLESIWYTSNLETKERIVGQLVDYVKQMRTLKSPFGSTIGSVLGGPVFDCRLYFMGVSGPFANEDKMNKQLRYLRPLEDWPDDVRHAHSLTHEIAFTHGDLAPRNIIVEGSTITAILDWESAGWFPAHWEYHKAQFNSFQKRYDLWRPWIPKFIPPFDMESKANMAVLRGSMVPMLKE